MSSECAPPIFPRALSTEVPHTVTPLRELLASGVSESNVTGDSKVWILRGVGTPTASEQEALIDSSVSTLAEVANFSPSTRTRIRNAWPSVDLSQLEKATLHLLSARQVTFKHSMTLPPTKLDGTAPLRISLSLLPEMRHNVELMTMQHPKDPAPDHFQGAKDKQNGMLGDELITAAERVALLGQSVQHGWQDGLFLLLECNSFGTTKWLYSTTSRRQDVRLTTLASVVIPNPEVEPMVRNAKQLALTDSEWVKLRLVHGTSYHLIFKVLNIQQPGPIFRCVYLDYCGMWTGRKSKKTARAMQFEYSDPSKEVEQLFKNKRFFHFATLAITAIRSRVKGGGHTVAPTVINDCYRYARESGYRLVLRQRCEYFNSSAMVLLIFHVYISNGKPLPAPALGASSGLLLPTEKDERERSKIAILSLPTPPIRLTQSNLVGQHYQLPGLAGASKCISNGAGGWKTFYNQTLDQTIRRQVSLDLMQRYLIHQPAPGVLYLLPNKHEGNQPQLMKLVGQTGGGWKFFVKHDAPADAVPFKMQVSVEMLTRARQK